MTLQADVNRPGSQKDLGSNWEPARSLAVDGVSGAKLAPRFPALAVARLPPCLWWGSGPVRCWLALLWYLLSPLFCEQAQQCLRLELFAGKFSLSLSSVFFSSSLCLSHSLGCYLTLAPSDCPQGIRSQSLP